MRTPPRTQSAFNLLKRAGFALLLLSINLTSHAQPPDTLWTRRYGLPNYDNANSVAQMRDGSFILAGETWNFESTSLRDADAYVVKVDSIGNELWSHTWGGDFTDIINKIIVLEDGFIAAGEFCSWPPTGGCHNDGWILRMDLNGDTLWTRQYDIADSAYGEFRDLIAVEDGNFLAAGWAGLPQTNQNFWLLKLTPDGEAIWSRTFGGMGWDDAWAITLASDGGYVACGNTTSFSSGGIDSWLIKVSPDGDSLWSHSYGDYRDEETRAIARALDGGFFLAGYNTSYSHGYDDAWIVRTDSDGNYLWDTRFASTSLEGQLDFNAIVATEDGGAVGAGHNNPASTNGQALFMAKVDSTGDSVWARSWFQSWNSYGNDLIGLLDGGFAAVGKADRHTRYEAWTSGDMWLIRLSPDMSPVSPLAPSIPEQFSLSTYPNPFNSTLSISLDIPLHQEVSLTLYDLLGREVDVIHRGRLSASTNSYTAPPELSSGIYFLRAATRTETKMQKVVLLK